MNSMFQFRITAKLHVYLCISRRNIAEKDDCRGAGKSAGSNQDCGRRFRLQPSGVEWWGGSCAPARELSYECEHQWDEIAHCFRCSRSGRYARNIGNPWRRRSRALLVAQLLRLFSRRCFPGGSFKMHWESDKRIAAIPPRPFRGEGSWRILLTWILAI